MKRNASWTIALGLGLSLAAGCGVKAKLAKSSLGQAVSPTGDGESADGAQAAPDTSADGEVPDATEGSIPLVGGETAEQMRAMAKVTFADAQAMAILHVPGAVESSSLGEDSNILVYFFNIRANGVLTEAKVNAGTGEYIVDAPDAGPESVAN